MAASDSGKRTPLPRPDDDIFLPYGRQLIEADDIAAVVEVLRGDWLTTGPKTRAFEDALARRVGAAHAVCCSSGTAALHLSALALGLGPGTRAIVPSLTFVATANAVRYVGAEVLFADVDPDSGLMGAAQFEAALARAASDGGAPVRAVLPVHLNGQCADVAEIAALAAERGIEVIQDAAHAIGTRYRAGGRGYAVGNGTHAKLTIFSFHPVKTIAMGEGGAVTTDDPALARRLRDLRNHGLNRDASRFENVALAFDGGGQPNPWYYELSETGFNYRASDLHCALGLSQLAKLDRFVARRAEIAALYDSRLARHAPRLRPIRRIESCQPAWHLYVALIDFDSIGVERARVMQGLSSAGIGSMVHYIPVHLQPYYRKRYGDAELPGAMAYYRRALSLPLFAAMADSDVDRVMRALERLLMLS